MISLATFVVCSSPFLPIAAQAEEPLRPEEPQAVTVQVTFVGAPEGEFAASLEPGAEPVTLRLASRSGDLMARSVGIEDLSEPVVLRYPSGPPARLSVTVGTDRYGAAHLPLDMPAGAVHQVSVDLGADRARRVRVLGLPSSAAGRAGLTNWAPLGALIGPDGTHVPIRGRWPLRLDPQGEGWVVPRGGHPPWLALETVDGGSRWSELLTESRTDELWTLRPAHRLVELVAAEGADLDVERGAVVAPWNGYDDDQPRRNRTFVELDPDRIQTVFVDGERVGCIQERDFRGHGADVIDLDRCELPLPAPNLVVHVIDPPAHGATLWFEPAGEPVFDSFLGRTHRTGAIVPPGEVARNAPTLGEWTVDRAGGLRASVTLPAGDYRVALEGDGYVFPDLVRVEPVSIVPGEVESLVLDVGESEEHVIAVRVGPDLREPGLDLPMLAVGAAQLWSGSYGRWIQGPEGDWRRLADRHVRLWTLGGPPETAVLLDLPGASGRRVDLRPMRLRTGEPSDRFAEADLVAVLRRPHVVRGDLPLIAGGKLFGWCDQVPRDMEPERHSLIVGGPPTPRTFQPFSGGRFRIWIRGEEATGVVHETPPAGLPILRDWWYATPGGVEFLGEGGGRNVDVTFALERPARLFIAPRASERGFRPEFIADVSPGERIRVWAPDSAARILAVPLPRRTVEEVYLGVEIEFDPASSPLATVSLDGRDRVVITR